VVGKTAPGTQIGATRKPARRCTRGPPGSPGPFGV